MQDSLTTALINSARGWTGAEPGPILQRLTGEFLARARADESLLSRITMGLELREPSVAAWIAVTCGSAVEGGADASLAGPRIFSLLSAWFSRLPRTPDDADPDSDAGELPQPDAEQQALLELFPYICQAAVSCLARLPDERERLRCDLEFFRRVEDLQACTHGAIWLREALLKSSGTIIVLHPPSGRGLRVRYQNVSNCFHLFSLLQTSIGTRLPGGREPDETIARLARGKSDARVSDEAWWHYGKATSSKPDLAASIWGEGMVRDIPAVDGMQVVLLWPPKLGSRTWSHGFMTPHLDAMPADVVIEAELGDAEASQWLEKIGLRPHRK